MQRHEVLNLIEQQPDISVLIVGGGVNGISTFRELALQGIDVALVEMADFSSGASAASSHMVHGGLRYLENGEFRLVQEALTERNRLLLNAAHYVRPLPTTIPIFKWMSGTLNAPLKFLGLTQKPRERGAFIIKAGLTMYDVFASTQRTMPTHSFMSKSDSLQRFPGMNQEINVTATYYDAWMPYPERICLEMIMDAEAANPNAHALNYMSVIGGADDTVTLKDELTGNTYTMKPQVVINAAGPWIDFANTDMSHQTTFIGGTKGSHLVIDHPELHSTLGGHEIFFENDDGRIVLIFPLEDRVLAGTTDIRIDDPDRAVCTENEIGYILSLINKVFPALDIGRDNVVFTYSGVRPLPAQDASTTGQISRDHSIRTIEAGNGTTYPVHALIGGKWTTFRAFGEQVANRVLADLDVPRQVDTDQMPIGGGANFPTDDADRRKWVASVASQFSLPANRVNELLSRYGTYARRVAKFMAAGEDSPIEDAPGYSVREVIFIVRHEKVVTLQDFVLRRSLLAMLGKVTRANLVALADIIGEELGWSDAEREQQITLTTERLRKKNLVDLERDTPGLIATGPTEEEAESIPETDLLPLAEHEDEPEPVA
ncbi:MAG: glycerol-3-phosphate dehydrogenase/oxidase [Chloroflexota bacterium]